MKPEAHNAAKRRLARIEGQVRGIGRMIDEGRYCVDVVRQLQSIRAALTGVERLVLDDHLATCVDSALRSDDIEERRDKVDELVALLDGRKR
ncbi:MAG: metal-sensitive transcriptional regulator [Pseudomonadota bacterium]